MSTTQNNEGKYSDLVGNFFTTLILATAKGIVKFFLNALYHLFMLVLAIIVVAVAVGVIAGGTTLSGVLFGKMFACVFCLLAVGVLFLIPVREFFKNISEKVKEVFSPSAPLAA